MKFIGSLLFIVYFSVSVCNAQSSNIQAANNWLKDNNIAKAKAAIDQAYENPSTNNDTKMWYYRGQVYLAIYRDTGEVGRSEPDAPEKAAISFLNVIKADNGHYSSAAFTVDDAYNQVWKTGVALSKRADKALKDSDLVRAERFYKLIFDVLPHDKENNLNRNNITTESINRNLYLVAVKKHDNEMAKLYLQKLIDVKFNEANIYIYMSNIYLAEKDTAKALTYIDMGRNRFEENQRLIDEEIRIYYAMHKTDVLIDKLSKAIESSPDNEVLYCIRGGIYKMHGEKEKAKADYQKAVEIKPDYADANFNLGAFYYNEANEKLSAAASIKNADQYARAKAEAEAIYLKAVPYYEKAHQADPKDRATMQQLKQLYFRQNDMDKYNKIKTELEEASK